MFALIDSMTHPASPFRDVERLYSATIRAHSMALPTHEIEDAVGAIPAFKNRSSFRFMSTDVEAGDAIDVRSVMYARPGLFEILAARPRLGRLPTQGEQVTGSVAVISDEMWRQRFHNRDRIGDAFVSIGDRHYSIVGVLPPNAKVGYASDIWIPDPKPDSGDLGVSVFRVVEPADTVAVQAQLDAIMHRLTVLYTKPPQFPFSAQVISLRPDPLELKDFHKAMIGAAICVLLIACANVAALMLARGMIRRRDYALRLALGATRGEIAREVIAEVVALAAIGCIAGAVVATWAVGIVSRATPVELRWVGFVQPQWSVRVLTLSGLAVFVSVAIAGGFPAFQASRTDPMRTLKDSGGATTGRTATRFRWLVMAELALSMTLVMGATLMTKSALRMARYDFGYDAPKLVAAHAYWLGRDATSNASRDQILNSSMALLRTLKEVQDATRLTTCSAERDIVTSDRTIEGGASLYVPGGCSNVGGDFFRTLGIPILDGRDFTAADAGGGGAVILDDRAAHILFPHDRAVGRMVKLGHLQSSRPWLTVVGVVRHQRLGFDAYPELGADTSAAIFESLPGEDRSHVGTIIVRPVRGARNVASVIAATLRDVAGTRSWIRVEQWTAAFQGELQSEQYLSVVFALLGAASLALGAAGLFSVVSYIAGQRTREYALRIALGATNNSVVGLVLRDALIMALGGTAAGAVLGMWGGFLIWYKMWDVYPVDAGALIVAEGLLVSVTMAAALVPALRATRSNPVDILRAS